MSLGKKIILVLTQGYLPAEHYGGPVTSLNNLATHLSENYEIRIITSNHELMKKEKFNNISQGWNQVNSALVYYVHDSGFSLNSVQSIVSSFVDRIVIIYLSSIYLPHINFPAIKLGRKLGIPVVLAPRGDLMKDAIAMKSKAKMVKKLVYLSACRMLGIFNGINFQSTSEEETDGIIKYLNVDRSRIFEISNFPVKQRRKVENSKSTDKLNIIFISRLMVKKNALLAIEAVGDISPKYQVKFDIYGPKEDLNYWEQCELLIAKINENKSNIEINYKGSLSPQEASTVYENYDCFLFPTFTENYGHVIAEALLSDCPVIISEGTTPFDDCNGHGGFTAPLSHPEELTERLETLANMTMSDYRDLLRLNEQYCEKKFAIEALKQSYIEMIELVSCK